jgi:hypothetical protein
MNSQLIMEKLGFWLIFSNFSLDIDEEKFLILAYDPTKFKNNNKFQSGFFLLASESFS